MPQRLKEIIFFQSTLTFFYRKLKSQSLKELFNWLFPPISYPYISIFVQPPFQPNTSHSKIKIEIEFPRNKQNLTIFFKTPPKYKFFLTQISVWGLTSAQKEENQYAEMIVNKFIEMIKNQLKNTLFCVWVWDCVSENVKINKS
jgi:hypothetical protein